MMITIDVEISEDDAKRLKNGEGTDYPMESDIFLKTVGGYVDAFEIMMMAFNRFGRKFRLSVEVLPDDVEIRPNQISSAFMSDAIRGKV